MWKRFRDGYIVIPAKRRLIKLKKLALSAI